jgi:hypothetical protein
MIKLQKIGMLLLAVLLMSQFNPQSTRITEQFFPDHHDLPEVTPALKKNKGFTNYAELMGFLNQLRDSFPTEVQLSFIGKTKNGLDIPLVKLQEGAAHDRVRVWLQGGLHGDEPASTESLLYLMYDLLHNAELRPMLSRLEIAVLPMANIDGYLKQRRNNAEDLDLNRDQTKLMAVETPQFKRAFAAFDPHVALDFHEFRPYRRDFTKLSTFGVTSAYDVMFLYSGNLNVPQALRDYTEIYFLQAARRQLDSVGYRHHDYFSTDNHLGDIHFTLGSNNARSSATNFALQNKISTLVEVRGIGIGRTSFKRRIHTGYLIARSYLEQAAVRGNELLMLLDQLNQQPNDTITIRSKRTHYTSELAFIDLEKLSLVNLAVKLQDALQSKPLLQRQRPVAYALLPAQASLAEKLLAFGYQLHEIQNDTMVWVEKFEIKDYQRSPQRYEKTFLQTISTQLKAEKIRLPKGSIYISMQQPKSNLIPELIEPEAPNSLVHFNLIPTQLGAILPIYRIIATK